MGFSVYGRIGGNTTNNTNNYGRDSYSPRVLVSRSRLGVGYSTPRVNPAANTPIQDAYNPKTTAFHKKDNRKLKTALLVVGAATAAFVARKPIESCVKGVKSVFSSGVKSYAKHCPNMAQAGRSFAEACKAPGRAIAKPFKAIAKLFTKKP